MRGLNTAGRMLPSFGTVLRSLDILPVVFSMSHTCLKTPVILGGTGRADDVGTQCAVCHKPLGEGDCLSCDMVRQFATGEEVGRRKPLAIEAAKTLHDNLLRGGNGNIECQEEAEWEAVCRETRQGIFQKYRERLAKLAEDQRRLGESGVSGKEKRTRGNSVREGEGPVEGGPQSPLSSGDAQELGST